MNLHKLAVSGLLVSLTTTSSSTTADAFDVEALDEALLTDLLEQYTAYEASTCTGAEGTTTYTYNFPGNKAASDWYAPFINFEDELFLAQMSHADPVDSKNSWKIRIGQGGNMYSHFVPNRHGETMPPQAHSDAPWVDEVHQSVSVNNNLNRVAGACNGQTCPPYYVHGAGAYQRDR